MQRKSINAGLSFTTLLSAAVLLAGCGGGGGVDTNSSGGANPPSVSAIVIDTPRYGTPLQVTVQGSNLDAGISLDAGSACKSLTETATPTASSRSFSCELQSIGTMTVKASSTTGSLLKSQSTEVPAPQVTMVTSMGTIVVQLDPTRAPISVDNFLSYVKKGFYSNTLFHRVVTGFVVQGGGFDLSGTQKATDAPIKLEAPASTGLSNTLGTIAMARTNALDSATSQFYFNTVDNTALDSTGGGYAVFGATVSGFNVVKAIEAVPVNSNSVPLTNVVLLSAEQTR